MTTLREIQNVRQIPGEHRRRWFQSSSDELIVWYAADGSIQGFQLCYDRETRERALTWKLGRGYLHQNVDDGEAVGFAHKRSPILLPDGRFDARRVLERFTAAASEIPGDIVTFVAGKLTEHPIGREP